MFGPCACSNVHPMLTAGSEFAYMVCYRSFYGETGDIMARNFYEKAKTRSASFHAVVFVIC